MKVEGGGARRSQISQGLQALCNSHLGCVTKRPKTWCLKTAMVISFCHGYAVWTELGRKGLSLLHMVTGVAGWDAEELLSRMVTHV